MKQTGPSDDNLSSGFGRLPIEPMTRIDRSACASQQDLITDVVSGAAGEGDRLRLEAHLASCDDCQAAFDNAVAVVAMTKISRPDPGEDFWEGYGDRLSQRMADTSVKARPGPRPVLHHLVIRRALQVAAALVLITSGFLVGRSSLNSTSENLGDDTPRVVNAELQNKAFAYLDRSRTVLLGVVNFDASQDDPAALNIDRRRVIANELVGQADNLKTELSAADEQRLSALISDLEVILLQLANIESSVDIPQIEMVRDGVDRKAILFKIDVEAMNRDDISSSNTSRTTDPSASAATGTIRSAI